MMEHFYENIKGWSIHSDQGVLLETLIPLLPEDPVIAELGVYQGRLTAMWNIMLINSGKDYTYYGIDHFQGSAEHQKGVDYFQLTIENLKPISEMVQIMKAESGEAAKHFFDQTFDLVYIDASHDYESVKRDIEVWKPKIKPGGILAGDDYHPGWPGVQRAVNESFPQINRIGKQQWWVVL